MALKSKNIANDIQSNLIAKAGGQANANNVDESRIRAIFREEFQKNYIAGAPKVPPHNHDKVNNLPVYQKDLVFNDKYQYVVSLTETDRYTLKASFPSSIYFYGIAGKDDVGGTERGIITGSAFIGNCFGSSLDPAIGIGTNILLNDSVIEACNFQYTQYDTLGSAIASQYGTANGLMYAADSSSTPFIQGLVFSFNNVSVVLDITIADGWTLQGNIMVT